MTKPKIDLSDVSSSQLSNELVRRDKLEQKEEEERHRRILWNEYMTRPPCDVVGRAYGGPGSPFASEYSLAHVTIAGNASRTYDVSATLAEGVKIYFGNALTCEDERELRNKLKQLSNDFIKSKMSDPAVVTTLICLCSPPIREKEAKAEWHKEAINRLNQYSEEELKEAKKKLNRTWETAHGQIPLINEALAAKRKGK